MSKTNYLSTQSWDSFLDHLAKENYAFLDNFLSDDLYQKIQDYFKSLLEKHEFSKAAIGSSQDRQVASSVRGDFIYWLDRDRDTRISEFFTLLDSVIANLRRQLFLSLSDYEFHLALYPPNTRYEKHVDQFRGKDNRVISMLIYLNDNWEQGDGGELKIYEEDGKETLIAPLGNRLVMFKSAIVEHEVLRTENNRKSLTGWLLHQPATLNNII